MARSIHTTRRTVRRLRRTQFGDPEAKDALLSKAEEEIDRKRLIKRQVKRERHQVRPPLAGTATETVPVEVLDAGPYVHHGITETDVRAMLIQLPPQATEGISLIQLCLGREYLRERKLDGEIRSDLTDPFTGRISHLVLPEVFGGPILGTYTPRTGRVCVHAFVYDPTRLVLPSPAVEAFLKLKALSTLLHEIAHHHDETARVRRGRWLADREATVENYAEQMELRWVTDLAIPYVERLYGPGLGGLVDWVELHGGARLTAAFFAGDRRLTKRTGAPSVRVPTGCAFQHWAGNVDLTAPLSRQRLSFAQEVHYADDYELCLGVLESVLQDEPENEAALTLKADTLGHLYRFDEASALASSLLARNEANSDAWWICVHVAEKKQCWTEMLALSLRWAETIGAEHAAVRSALTCRAVAECALGQSEAMEASVAACMKALAQIRPLAAKKLAEREAVLRRTIRRRAGIE